MGREFDSHRWLIYNINMQSYRTTGYKPRSIRRVERKNKRNIVISIVLTIGFIYMLLNFGLPLLIGSLSYFNKFKTQEKPSSIVEDIAIAPPVLNIPFEATNSATITITGYASPDSKVQIYIDDSLVAAQQTQTDGSFKAENIQLVLGNNNIHATVEITDTNGNTKQSMPSKNIRLTYNNEKPLLEVTEPADGQQIIGDKKVRVSGKTDINNSISLNEKTVIVNNEGNFSTEISLNDGENIITITATNPVGNKTQAERRVNVTPS